MSNKTDFLAIAIASAVNGQFLAVQNLSLALSLVSSDKAKEVIKDFKEKTVNLGLSKGYANDLSSLASFVDDLKLVSFKEIKTEKTTLALLSARLEEKGVINLASLKGFKAFNVNTLKASVQDAYKFEDCLLSLCTQGDDLIIELAAFNKLSQGYIACKAIALKVSDFIKLCEADKKRAIEDAPIEDAPIEDAPIEDAPIEDAPIEDAPIEDAPIEDAPIEDTNNAAAAMRLHVLASLTTSELLDVIATHDNDSLQALLKGIKGMITSRNKKAA